VPHDQAGCCLVDLASCAVSGARRQTLDGRVVVITGGSRGLGAAMARGFSREGAAVAIAARTEEIGQSRHAGTIHEVAGSVRHAGGRAIAVRCDVTREQDLVALVEQTRAELGPVDVLVNNAVAFGSSSLLEMSLDRYRLCFEVNLFAAFRLMQLVLPEMVARGGGSVVNISSDASRRPPEGPYDEVLPRGASAYGSSKLALEHLTRSAAAEFADRGIAINALMPSLPVPTQSVLDSVADLTECLTEDQFTSAALLLATADPDLINGTIWYSEDLLHPEAGRRGWLGSI
jgi:7-alpha-hydroxysteroid dehydrogenase